MGEVKVWGHIVHQISSYIHFVLHQSIPDIWLFQNLTLKMQGQDHSVRSHNRSNIQLSGSWVPVSARYQEPLSRPWACPLCPHGQTTMTLHIYRPSRFQRTWFGVNSCWGPAARSRQLYCRACNFKNVSALLAGNFYTCYADPNGLQALTDTGTTRLFKRYTLSHDPKQH